VVDPFIIFGKKISCVFFFFLNFFSNEDEPSEWVNKKITDKPPLQTLKIEKSNNYHTKLTTQPFSSSIIKGSKLPPKQS
jgi:hypothetical protein